MILPSPGGERPEQGDAECGLLLPGGHDDADDHHRDNRDYRVAGKSVEQVVGVYQALEAAGLTVGHDIAVVHFNDYAWLSPVLRPRWAT